MMQELQEREVEEHLAQLLRKLSTKDNSGERRSLRTKVRNKFPATKRIGRSMLVVDECVSGLSIHSSSAMRD